MKYEVEIKIKDFLKKSYDAKLKGDTEEYKKLVEEYNEYIKDNPITNEKEDYEEVLDYVAIHGEDFEREEKYSDYYTRAWEASGMTPRDFF